MRNKLLCLAVAVAVLSLAAGAVDAQPGPVRGRESNLPPWQQELEKLRKDSGLPGGPSRGVLGGGPPPRAPWLEDIEKLRKGSEQIRKSELPGDSPHGILGAGPWGGNSPRGVLGSGAGPWGGDSPRGVLGSGAGPWGGDSSCGVLGGVPPGVVPTAGVPPANWEYIPGGPVDFPKGVLFPREAYERGANTSWNAPKQFETNSQWLRWVVYGVLGVFSLLLSAGVGIPGKKTIDAQQEAEFWRAVANPPPVTPPPAGPPGWWWTCSRSSPGPSE
jgi:hypothetical protein